MKLQYQILLLTVLIVAIASMPKKVKDTSEEAEKTEVDNGAGSAGRQTLVQNSDEGTVAGGVSPVRPIRRELGRYSTSRPEARAGVLAPFRGNAAEAIRAAMQIEVTDDTICIYGEGILAPFFRSTLNRFGMTKAEEDETRRYTFEGTRDIVTRAMQAAGFNDFVMNQEGGRMLVGHLVRQLLERQDRLVETGPLFSPMKASHDQASRLPAILDYHRWRVTVLPDLGPHGYVRITGTE